MTTDLTWSDEATTAITWPHRGIAAGLTRTVIGYTKSTEVAPFLRYGCEVDPEWNAPAVEVTGRKVVAKSKAAA